MNERIPVKTRTPSAGNLPAVGGPMQWIRSEIDRLFEDFGRPAPSIFNFGPRSTGLVPALEMTVGEKEYRLSVELPGLTADDVHLEVVDGVLILSGEKKEQSERKDGGYYMSERRDGTFTRQIALPTDVDANAIGAKFENGVLQVMLAKDEKAAARSHKIMIEH
ncbi:MAG: Hsp20/alpha crystallin family protein [Pseudomonadota bacterium]|jgi:HSP20 family protein